MMYYNMRVRAARRGLSETRQALVEEKNVQSLLPAECIRTLSHALKDVRTPPEASQQLTQPLTNTLPLPPPLPPSWNVNVRGRTRTDGITAGRTKS